MDATVSGRVGTTRGSGWAFVIRLCRSTKAHPLPRVVLTCPDPRRSNSTAQRYIMYKGLARISHTPTDEGMDWKNQLYYGDNLRVLREEIADESVDLVYLDPPFNSAANYNVLFREASGEQSAAQITAFEDTWHWTQESEAAYQELQRLSSGRDRQSGQNHPR